MKKLIITQELNYVCGHLRYGHKELILEGEDLEYYNSLSEEEKKNYFHDNSELIIDDYCVDDYGDGPIEETYVGTEL